MLSGFWTTAYIAASLNSEIRDWDIYKRVLPLRSQQLNCEFFHSRICLENEFRSSILGFLLENLECALIGQASFLENFAILGAYIQSSLHGVVSECCKSNIDFWINGNLEGDERTWGSWAETAWVRGENGAPEGGGRKGATWTLRGTRHHQTSRATAPRAAGIASSYRNRTSTMAVRTIVNKTSDENVLSEHLLCGSWATELTLWRW